MSPSSSSDELLLPPPPLPVLLRRGILRPLMIDEPPAAAAEAPAALFFLKELDALGLSPPVPGFPWERRLPLPLPLSRGGARLGDDSPLSPLACACVRQANAAEERRR